jgi:hypothetical protein
VSGLPQEERELAREVLDGDYLFLHDPSAVVFHIHQHGLAGGRGRLHGSNELARLPGWELRKRRLSQGAEVQNANRHCMLH